MRMREILQGPGRIYALGVLMVGLVMAGCAGVEANTPTPAPTDPTATRPAPTVRSATHTPLPPTATHTSVASTISTATPDPLAGLTIEDLRARSYGAGELTVERQTQPAFGFERHYFSYPSDGLDVYGFMNVPLGEGPFPTAFVLHGYINPSAYDTLAYTTVYADELARAGYLVLHPNYRNYPPSDVGPNDFRIGYAIDVLNLLAIVRRDAGQPGPFERAAPGWEGLFGHSMGGGIGLRAITVDPEVEVAVLYGSMSGDERRNHERIVEWSGGRAGWEELNTSEEDMRRISPIYHLEGIEAQVSIHHGGQDRVVPPEWSAELCELLRDLDKPVECFEYPEMPHTFYGQGEELLMQRSLEFFRSSLP